MNKAATTILSLVLIFGAACSMTAQSVDQLTNRQKALREEAVIALRIKLEQAESSRNEAKARDQLLKTALLYEEAVGHLNTVGPIPIVEAERQRTIDGMAEVRLNLAAQFQKAQKFYEADQEAVRILKLDPNHEEALNFKAANDKLIARYTGRQPSRDAITQIPAVRQKQVQASTMIQDARLFLELNKLEEAEAKLSEAKALDPESDAVWYYLSLLNQKKFQRETRKREITSQEKMIEVSNYWDPGLNKNELPISNSFASTNLVHTGLGRQKILSKMDRIVLDEVSFDGLPLSEVVQFLYDEAKERDAEDEGINFTISNHMDTGVQATNFGGVDPLTGLPALAPLPTEPVDLYEVSITIRPPLRNVKLSQVVELVTTVADTPIKYSVLDYVVLFTKKTEETEPLYTRTYNVDPDVFIQGMEGITGISLDQAINTGGGGQGGGQGGGGGGGGQGGGGGGQGGGTSMPILFADPTGLSAGGGLGGGQGGGGGGGGGGQGGGGQQGGGSGIGASGGVSSVKLMQDVQVLVRNFFAAAGVNFQPGQIIGPIGGQGGQGGGGGGGGGLGGGGGFGGGGQGGLGGAGGLGGQQSDGKAVFFNDRNGTLFVRATMTDLDIIEQAIQTLNKMPPQLTIEAKFAEFTQNDSRALGFDWFLGNVLAFGDKGVLAGGTSPSMNGEPSPANSLGIFPASGGVPTAQPQDGSDQRLTNGVRTDGPDGTPIPAMATFTGILTNPQFRVVLRALDQRDGVDVLASPSITTVSGRQASIRAVDMRTIVTGTGANQNGGGGGGGAAAGGVNVGAGGGNTPLGTTITPQTTVIPEGPMLDIVPYVSADGYTVKLTILPTLIQFVGYDDPGPFAIIAQGGAGSTVANPLVAQLPLPRLRTRQVLTSVVVWDGQTVVLGGLISEDVAKHKDKVPVLGDIPFLGRFFRSESNFTKKKNLSIFVTPTIVDPAGNRVHDENNLPYDPLSLPQHNDVQ